MSRALAAVAALAFIGCVLAANYVTSEYGMVPVGFGLVATAGTYFAGLSFVLRDAVQDGWGKRATLAIIALGAGLSFLVSDPFIALASAVAFGLSETADLIVYTPLRKHGYIRAAFASNAVGAFVDTVAFLWIAGFPIAAALPGQMVGKVAVTLAVVALVATIRARRAAASLGRARELANRLAANGAAAAPLTQPLAARLIHEALGDADAVLRNPVIKEGA